MVKAFKAASKESDTSAKEARNSAKQQEKAQRQAAEAVKDAARTRVDGEKRVAAAQKAAQRAQESLTQARVDARRELDNYQLSLRGAYWDEKAAEGAVTDARKRLREANQFGSGADADDRRNARIDYEQAVQRLLETQQRNKELKAEAAEAARVGVEGSQKVRDAKDAQAEAEDGVTDAVESAARANEDAQKRIVDAQESLTEAMVAGSEAADAYRDALEDLSPAARDFVQKVRGLGDEWRSLRMVVQEGLFAGLGDEIVDLSDNLLPTFKDGLGGIATEINTGLKSALSDLGSESSKLDWTRILENTRLSIQPLMGGLTELMGAFQDIAAVGSDLLPGLSGSFEDTMKRFHEWTSSEEGQNSIRKFLDNAIQKMGELKDLVVAAAQAIGGIFATSNDSGESMVKGMTDGLKHFADWMKTAEGEAKMKQFWEDVRATVASLLQLVGDAVKLAGMLRGTPSQPREDGTAPKEDNRSIQDRFIRGDDPYRSEGVVEKPQSKFLGVPWMARDYEKDGVNVDKYGNEIVGRWGFFPGFKRDSFLGGIFGGRDRAPEAPKADPSIRGGFTESGDPNSMGFLDTKKLLEGSTGGGPGRGVIRFDDSQFDTTKMDKWRETWGALTGDVDQGWRTKLDPAFGGILGRQGEIGTSSDENIGGTASDSWSGLGSLVDGSWTDDILPVFTKIGEKLPGVSGFFGTAVAAIEGDWSKLKGYLAEPIDWVIREVFNNGIGRAWSAVDGFLGDRLPDWVPIKELGGGFSKGSGPAGKVTGMARGGMVPLEPGAIRGQDSVLRNLMPGEIVMSVPAVNAAGADNLLAFNRAALQGKNPSAEGMFQWGMAEGGRVQRDDPAWEMLKRGHDFAKAQDGKPYQWAGPSGVGSSFDCSGFLLSIAAEVLGRNPWQRYGYTGSFNPASGGPFGIKPGLGAGLSFGVFDNPGGDGGGHMAGTLSGVEGLPDINVESSGGEGVRYGRGARGATNPMFPWQFHLPIVDGAFVDPGPGGGGGSGPSQADQKGFLARKLGSCSTS
ncbi:hypothetical protein GS532_21215 [Rhodococcus hoagii]|nr:hypothetical protein [Prescottella equi]